MVQLNQLEYKWVKQTRDELLRFCGELTPEDFARNLETFGDQSVRGLLMHMADCYHAWLNAYLLAGTTKPLTPKDIVQHYTIEDVRARFAAADELVEQVMAVFADRLDEAIVKRIPWRENGDSVSLTARKLLLHTVTHEFHHKGHITAMARQMGYIPVNTDVLGTED
ncbi:DinB family protein [Paenibacillus aestuarii]|uniref:DinB family protein n=1 Tax=Paenibacillus aestuarii TaxID=516965 RepID=A0ABW0K489_9BACL|nr:DinB family protein [Paenibacillus aestuarii]